ncbi:MAG: peptidase MA family metallohydrolase, partial [Chloroflexota bacterium]|nr:peptidase MA family metallohydrolase [Chloroflexota bacterium]
MSLWLAVIAVIATAAAPSVLAVDATFGKPTATAKWGEQVAFSQPAQLSGAAKRVEVLLEFPGGLGPHVVEVPPPTAGGSVTLRYSLLLADSHIRPNSTITTRWRITGQDGSIAVGPPVTVLYQDTRFDWKMREGALVRLHWYEGTEAFGDRALRIAETAIRETSLLLGVTEEAPIDFFVYADGAAFREAMGPSTGEFVVGQAIAETRTLFGLIAPGQINDQLVEIVIPHELSHLVFDTAVHNPYHFPALWLNEGLAVYLSAGYAPGDRLLVENAAKDGSLIPLGALNSFPSGERAFLAYAEGVSAVDYLVRIHGRETLVSLIKSYTAGMTDDEAFKAALGVDVAGLDAAWRKELNAREPTVHGPQPAPAGPLPPGWSDAEGSPAPSLPPGAPSTG